MHVTDDINHMTRNIDKWAVKHHPYVLEYLRIALGVFIFIKGIMFVSDYRSLQHMIEISQFKGYASGIAHLIAFAHLAGGPMIALGLKTRFACLVQIPILIGAVLFTSFGKGIYAENYYLVEAAITLILLIFFAFYGSGYLSLDRKLRDNTKDILY
ncbi:DoxX family protein [Adhaeribacter terreus]|uniref:DoxX family protein n=1 Tax=Adhaeribacter terreus TaxID=529703 RepID=A0ABW0EAW6_9BACT